MKPLDYIIKTEGWPPKAMKEKFDVEIPPTKKNGHDEIFIQKTDYPV